VLESAPIKANPFAVPDSKQDLLGDGGRGPKQRRAATNCHGESEGREPHSKTNGRALPRGVVVPAAVTWAAAAKK